MSSDPDALRNQRQHLRREVRRQVAALSSSDRQERSARVCQHLAGWSVLDQAEMVMAFWPLERPDGSGEPDILPLLRERLVREGKLCLPRTDWDGGGLEAVRVSDLSDVVPERYGIQEPRADLAAVPVQRLDVVLVPGVAFDHAGNRLGHGMGFYDRFLARDGVRAVRCGVGFEVQVVDAIPASSDDVPMQILATEAGCVPVRPQG